MPETSISIPSTSLTTGRSVLSSGSTTVVDNLHSALTASNSYGAAGGLGATRGAVSDHAPAIVSGAASKASDAKNTYTSKETAQSTFSSAMSSQSGVNLDEETARLSTLQNQYSAVSELIKTINAMFSSLLDAVKSSH